MSSIIRLMKFEEGFRDRPYRDTEGYPTVGFGFKLGPKLLHARYVSSLYDFTLPEPAACVWLEEILLDIRIIMANHAVIGPAYAAVEDDEPRLAVLTSMAYQMGVDGLGGFRKTLGYVSTGDFDDAAHMMLQSKWARQTPNRARRHAEQMRSGLWAKEYGL